MERRKAITTASAASLTLLAGAAGIALNSGIVSTSGDDNVGQISPVVTTANPPVAVYVDDPAATAPRKGAPLVESTTSQPVTTSTASAYHDDDRYEHERDERDDDRYEHESDERDEYEGAEDDD